MSFDDRRRSHEPVELMIKQTLESMGFSCPALPYHESLSETDANLLRQRYSPTALYLRNRSDRVAIHQTMPLEFEWEVKTRNSAKYENLAVEALQLAEHVCMNQMDVKCLYIYVDQIDNFECGFWTNELPVIDSIRIPSRWNPAAADWYKSKFARMFPSTLMSLVQNSNGSNTPFALILKRELNKQRHWKQIVGDALAICETATIESPSRLNTQNVSMSGRAG